MILARLSPRFGDTASPSAATATLRRRAAPGAEGALPFPLGEVGNRVAAAVLRRQQGALDVSTGAGTVVQRGLVIGDRTFASSDGPELKKILAAIGVTLTTQQTRALDTALFLKDESLPDWLTEQKIDFDKARLVAACRPPAPTAPEVTGQVGVALAEITDAVSGKGGRIGDSHYSFKVEDDRITVTHDMVTDVSCSVTFKITAGVLGVKHILSRPYEGNGLGLLLVAAMLKLAKARDARAATLSTDNQAMKFWANFGLRQDTEVPIDTAIGSLRDPLRVTDPPVEKGG